MYPGIYGDWSVEAEDEREVLFYRLGIAAAAAGSTAALAAAAIAPDADATPAVLNAAYATGAIGLGTSLQLIHIYVDPLKKFLQVRGAQTEC